MQTKRPIRYVLPPLLAALVLGAIGAVAVWTGQPLLAPSLGAAVFSQMLHAQETSARPYNLLFGQLIGGAAGFLGVVLAGQVHAAPLAGVFQLAQHPLPWGRVLACALAAGLAAAAQIAVSAETPVGGATALVIALGVDSVSVAGAARLLVGIALVMVLGDAARRLILRTRAAGE